MKPCNRPDCPLYEAPYVGFELFSEPSTQKRLAIVGEAPGHQEAFQNRPFIGPSGEMLRKILSHFEVDLDEVLITNVCACLPNDDSGSIRAPSATELECCAERLRAELQSFQPTQIIAVGGTAAEVLATPLPITSAHGCFFYNEDYKCNVLPTLHPAHVLRTPEAFRDILEDIRVGIEGGEPTKIVVEKVLVDATNFEACLQALERGEKALDCETTDLNPLTDKVRYIGITNDSSKCCIFSDSFLRSGDYLAKFKQFIERNTFVTQNGNQFDRPFLRTNYDIDLKIHFDTMLAHYILDERTGTHSLNQLARRYLGLPFYKEKGKKTALPDDSIYGLRELDVLAADASVTLQIAGILGLQLSSDEKQLLEFLLSASEALGEVELEGILVDKDYLQELEARYAQEENILEEELRELLGDYSFNVNSSKQVAKVLYDDLRLPVKGTRTTNVKRLEELLEDFGENVVVNKIAALRQHKHIRATYIKGLLGRIDEDSKVRTSYQITGTPTGRLSSRNPNLQNVPQVLGPVIRNAFVAAPGQVLIEGDYSQLELRVAAWYSEEDTLVEAFKQNVDIHAATASQIFNKPLEQVTSNERHIAKMFNFGMIYGRQAKSMAKQLKISVPEAEKYLKDYFGRLPKLKAWLDSVKKLAIDVGEVSTPLHRTRRFPLICDANFLEAQNQAANMPIQSLASDICLTALTTLHRLSNEGKMYKVLLTVHDSILCTTQEQHLHEVIEIMRNVMQNVPFDSPNIEFKVDFKVGKRWGDLKKL